MIEKPETNTSSRAPTEWDLYVADLQRRELNSAVNRELHMYLNTGDGRHLWRAFLRLHDAGVPIPKNFLDKFAEWAGRLLDAESPKEIAVALDLAGNAKEKRGARQSEAYRKRWLLANEVECVKELYRISATDAIRAVARNRGKTFDDVKKVYYQVLRAPRRTAKPRRRDLDRVLNQWGRV